MANVTITYAFTTITPSAAQIAELQRQLQILAGQWLANQGLGNSLVSVAPA